MSWVRLDDGFDENPKQLRMSSGAVRLYVCALTFCARQRQLSGYMTSEQAQGLRRKLPGVGAKAVDELVSLNAWEPADGGYLVHDFDTYVEKSSTERVRKHRALKRAGNTPETVSSPFHETPLPLSPLTTPLLPPPPDPVPEPVPNPPVVPPSRGTNGLAVENPDVVAYGECLLSHGRQLSAEDLEVLRGIPYEFDRLSRSVVLEAIEDVAAKFAERQKPMPKAKYLLGKLADLQVRASDAGARSRTTSGFTRIGTMLSGGGGTS